MVALTAVPMVALTAVPMVALMEPLTADARE